MEKVYLLLRNNIESGPFTYTQLVKQDLNPADLIWVEGESTSWLTPAELAALRQSKPLKKIAVEAVPVVAPIAVHVAPPVVALPVTVPIKNESSLAQSGEALSHFQQSHSNLSNTSAESIDLRIHKKGRRTISADQLVAAAFIALVACTAWFGRHQFFQGRSEVISSSVSPASFLNEQSFAAKKEEPQTTLLPDTVVTSAIVATTITPSGKKLDAVTPQPRQAVKTDAPKKEMKQEAIVVQNSDVKENKVNEAEQEDRPKPASQQTVAVPPQEKNEAPAEKVEESEPRKKKSFGQAIKGIFKKKKKDPDETQEMQK